MDDRAVRTTILGTAVCVCVLLVAASPGRADNERQRQTLAGLKGLSIVVEDLSPEAEKDGLSSATLQADLEAKVRGAGISVLTDDQAGRAPGSPHLYLKISAMKHTGGFYAYHLLLGVRQRVTLVRAARVAGFAMTWSATDSLGTVAWANLPSIREDVKAKADQFVKAYLAANPPASRPR